MNKLIFLLFGLLSFFAGTVYQKNKLRVVSEKDKIIFAKSCEIGVLKHCPVDRFNECRQFCSEFIQDNPDFYERFIYEEEK